ncbi:MAG: FISUMP domain-containing protein [Tenuifilaceae bacterium]|jgi:uncharacterized protein (TIGR02145 family)|nr:FISUMP domain-containing protein [Tenuifilaceae bacterium]
MEKNLLIKVLLVTVGVFLFSFCNNKVEQEAFPPIADFSVSNDQIYVWEKVTFFDASDNEPIEWEWFFEGGDPEVSIEREPEVLYKEPGNYRVKLTVRNENGESEKEVESFIKVSEYQNYFGTLTDPRDGQEYKIVKIGNVDIMAENLRYLTGDAVYYDNDPANGEKYGLLYKWETALEACPAGWRLPTKNEYSMIREYLGGENVAGGKLKMSGTEFWMSPNKNGTNETGFSAVGAGGYFPGHLEFFGMHEFTSFWTQTEATDELVWCVELARTSGMMYISNYYGKEPSYFSVRCIKD